jgi:hypothetical protein
MLEHRARDNAASVSKAKCSLMVLWFATMLAAGTVYVLTAHTGIQGRDGGYYALRVLQNEVVNAYGLAASHPLHYGLSEAAVWLGRGQVFPSLVVLSALAGAVAVANLFACARILTQSNSAAIVSAVSLFVSHTFWQMSTLVEVQTLTVAFMSAECFCVLKFARSQIPKWIVSACLLNGLAVANHLQGGLTTPLLMGIIVWMLVFDRLRLMTALWCALAWILGSLPYSVLVLFAYLDSGDLFETLRSALVGEWGAAVLNVRSVLRPMLTTLFFTALNFPNLTLFLSAVGMASWGRSDPSRLIRWYIGGALLIHALFAYRYNVPDQYTFLLPAGFFLALFAGVGWVNLARLFSARKSKLIQKLALASILLTPMTYLVIIEAARKGDWLAGRVQQRPFEDSYLRILAPWSFVDRGVDRAVRAAMDHCGPGGLIMVEDHWQHHCALGYEKIQREWPDVQIARLDQFQSAEQLKNLQKIFRSNFFREQPIVFIPAEVGAVDFEPPIGYWRREQDLYVVKPLGR